MRRCFATIAGALWVLSNVAHPVVAAVVSANPSNYHALLTTLKPGPRGVSGCVVLLANFWAFV